MKRMLLTAALVLGVTGPVFAQVETVTCGDYSAMDNAKQMETVAALESQTSEMAKEDQLTADAIHQKLTATCKDQVDMLVVDVLKAE